MSLVNDMLRDLDARRAAPAERLPLEGLYAVDEEGARRRDRWRRLRVGTLFLAAVILTGLLVGLMIGRITGRTPEGPVLAAATEVATPAVLEVLPQHEAGRFVLQLLLEQSVAYQRTDESGAVTLLLPGLRLAGGDRTGRLQQEGRSLSWRVEHHGNDVLVMLVGLADQLQVSDRLEPAGRHWQLWLEVRTDAQSGGALDIDQLPQAEPGAGPEPLPDWTASPADPPRADAPRPTAAGRAQVAVTPRLQDPLAPARQALLEQDYARAEALLESLHQRQPDNQEVTGLLARAYLGHGQQARVLNWLPAQLGKNADDSELRVLLARAQLQSGQASAAVTTLASRRPLLAADPGYHALLAATFQQAGQWQESAEVYRQLVDLRPAQAAWRLGLAIALEQLGQPDEALGHYRQALQGKELDGAAREFAGSRAQALGGRG